MIDVLLQAPIPPLPPLPQVPDLSPVIISSAPPLPPEVMAILIIGSLLLVGAILLPVARAIARRIDRRSQDEAIDRSELEELRHRMADLEERQQRVHELEERVDFAERLLAERGREPERLQRGGGTA